jgi:NAD(P)-dependent dehydrogenase (short-subunit alcohol dehydrogenase family)
MGRVALIAGASHPFTRPIAVAFAERGIDVALSTNLYGESATFAMNSIANELWALDRRHLALPAGVTPADAVQQTANELGRLDLLLTLPEREAPNIDAGESMLDYLRDRLVGVLLLGQAAATLAPDGRAILNCVVREDASANPVAAASEAGIKAATRAMSRAQPRLAVNAASVWAQTDPRDLATFALELLDSQVTGQVFEI